MVCRNTISNQVVPQHVQNGRFATATYPRKDFNQWNISICS